MNLQKRKSNENEFDNWIELPNGGRQYWNERAGNFGWKARYVKEVDSNEMTIKFYQEIYNQNNELVEIHHKYPKDLGHQKL